MKPDVNEPDAAAAAIGPGGLDQSESVDSIAAARADRDARDKAITTAMARAALAGFELHLLDDGQRGALFILSRWNLTRELPDLAAVNAFLDRVGAPA